MVKWRQIINNAALITAAGKSLRTGGSIKKEFKYINGKPVLVQAVLPFLESEIFNHLIVIMSPENIKKAGRLLNSFIPDDNLKIVPGGETRQESVLSGLLELENLNPDYVLIHDGARPWVTCDIIKKVFYKTREKKACIPAIKAQDAMKSIKSNDVIEKHLGREITYCAQTPQGFKYIEILEAHKKAHSDNLFFIDDSEIYSKYIGPVYIVEGDVVNRKITYKHDLEQL